MGANVTYDTDEGVLAYYVDQRTGGPELCAGVEKTPEVEAAIQNPPRIQFFPHRENGYDLPPFKNDYKSKTYVGEMAHAKHKEKEMTCGMFLHVRSPSLHREFHYDE